MINNEKTIENMINFMKIIIKHDKNMINRPNL